MALAPGGPGARAGPAPRVNSRDAIAKPLFPVEVRCRESQIGLYDQPFWGVAKW